jgi:hypothetical protein
MENMTNGTTMGIDWSSKPVVKEPKRVKLLNNWILSGITIIAIDALTNQPVRGWIATKTLPLKEGVDISIQGHGVCVLGTPRIPEGVIPVIDNWVLVDMGGIQGFYSGTKIVYFSGSLNEQIERNNSGYAQNVVPGAIFKDDIIGPIELGTCMSDETDPSII